MRQLLTCATTLMTALLLAGSLFAGLGPLDVDFSLSGGNTSNLIKDYTNRETSNSTTRLELGYHPVSWAELRVTGQNTLYGQVVELSNLLWGIGGTLLPMSDESSVQLYLTGNYRDRDYRDKVTDVTSSEFSSGEYDAMAGVSWTVKPTVRLRTGISHNATSYGLDEVRDRKVYDIFGGCNITLPAENSLDFEAGLSLSNLDYVPSRPTGIRRDRVYEFLEKGDLNTFYLAPRLSRTIFGKTGVSLTYSHREFTKQPDSAVVYGRTTGALSPWASIYEGNGVTLLVKTYLIPKLIVTAGAGYWDKHYLPTLETVWDAFLGGPVISTMRGIHERNDLQRQAYLGLQWPMAWRSGLVFEPSLHLSYTYNSSSIDVYDYHDLSISTTLSFRM